MTANAPSAAELEQRFIDGDSRVTHDQIEDAREAEARASRRRELEQSAALAAEQRDAEARTAEADAKFWDEYVPVIKRHLAGDPELAEHMSAVTTAVSSLRKLVESRIEEKRRFSNAALIHERSPMPPDPELPATAPMMLPADGRTPGHFRPLVPYVEIDDAITAAFQNP